MKFKTIRKVTLEQNQVEISIRAAGLNCRDVLSVMDLIDIGSDRLGQDCSGIVSALGCNIQSYSVGDEVMGISDGSIATTSTSPTELLLKKPKIWSFEEAATVPIAFLTAYASLVNLSQLKRGEKILIHTATGGVGLAAIQIAFRCGSKIYATASSLAKKQHLKALGILHIYHSRDTSYSKAIMDDTHNEGVHVVLNSLTGIGFIDASVQVCAPKARFVEMSREEIWTPDKMHFVRPDLTYFIVTLDSIIFEQPKTIKNTFCVLEKLFEANESQPLPYRIFNIKSSKKAFRFMQQARQIGKIVIVINGASNSNDVHFRKNGTYLITGGLGILGIAVAEYVIANGAGSLALVSRRVPNTQIQKKLDYFRSLGVKVNTFSADVSSLADLKSVFVEVSRYNVPLCGIIHAAGMQVDSIIINQNWGKYELVFRAKVQGAWNLHNLSQNYVLEHFILFSSTTSIFGSPGQSNDGAANSFLDSLAYYRFYQGFPCLSINCGFLTNTANQNMGFINFSTLNGMKALGLAISCFEKQVMVCHIDWPAYKRIYNAFDPWLMEVCTQDHTVQMELAENGIFSLLKETKHEKILDLIKDYVTQVVSEVLGLQSKSIEETKMFLDMGMDSLMSLEIINKIQTHLGGEVLINSSILLDYPSIEDLSKYIVNSLSSNRLSTEIPEVEEHLELRKAIKLDSNLCANLKVDEIFKRPQEFQNILLTGVTGTLGPYILDTLIKVNSKAKIFCMVRAKSISLAEHRLRKTLIENYIDESALKNCIVLNADIGDEYFSLERDKYFKLSEIIDAVVHLATKVNHVEKYKTRIGIRSGDIRSVNVLGTKHILKFAAANKNKFLLFASTLCAICKSTWQEKFPESDEFGDGVTMGYAATKFTCEKLLKQAMDKGIHCIALRYPLITGNGEMGQFHFESDHFMMLQLTCLKLNMIPKTILDRFTPFIPVGIVARISVKMLLNPNTALGVYNFVGPCTWTAFKEVAKEFGYSLEVVDDNIFINAIIKEGESCLLYRMKEIYHRENGIEHFFNSMVFYSSGMSYEELKKRSERFCDCVPELDYLHSEGIGFMRKYFKYAKSHGILDQYCQ